MKLGTPLAAVLVGIFVAATYLTMPVFGAEKTIAKTAAEEGNYNTLAKAPSESGLIPTLQGKGPFTILFPTDAAFEKMPAGTVEALLADKETLRKTLMYHIIPGKLSSTDIAKLKGVKAMNGRLIVIKSANGIVYINQSQLLLGDISASNGMLHSIDRLLVPPAE